MLARMRAHYEALIDALQEAAAAAMPTHPGHVALSRGSQLDDHERLGVSLAAPGDVLRTKLVVEEFIALVDEWAPLCLVPEL